VDLELAARGLRDKYLEIKRLRLADATEAQARPALSALVQRFPGALRELDRLEMAALDGRLETLDAVLSGSLEAPPWLHWQASYHGWMRAALRMRRLLRGVAGVEGIRAVLERHYVPADDEPQLAGLDGPTLTQLVRPPGGRLNPWVLGQLAALYGVSVEELEASLFG